MNHHVRAERPCVTLHALLLDEVAAFDHAGQLNDSLELHLTPSAADVGGPKRSDQPLGLLTEHLLRFSHRTELSAQSALGPLPRLVKFGQLPVDLLKRFAERRDHPVDGHRPRVQFDASDLLCLLQLRAGELEEALAVGLESIVRQRLEAFGKCLLRLLDQEQLLLRGLPFLGPAARSAASSASAPARAASIVSARRVGRSGPARGGRVPRRVTGVVPRVRPESTPAPPVPRARDRREPRPPDDPGDTRRSQRSDDRPHCPHRVHVLVSSSHGTTRGRSG